jgi:DNA-binding transcriptional ArsR family regulator
MLGLDREKQQSWGGLVFEDLSINGYYKGDASERSLDMRRLCLVLAIAALLPALASAAPVSSEIVSDSPVELFGRVTADNDGLRIFHESPIDASLKATVYDGTLVDYQRRESCGGSTSDTSQLVSNVTSGQPADAIGLELGPHALMIYAPTSSKDLRLADGPATASSNPNSVAPFDLAPNPYLHANMDHGPDASGRPGSGFSPYSEAFSTDPFLLVPTGRLDLSSPGILYLESGDLRVTRGGHTDIYRSKTTTESVNCSPLAAFPTQTQLHTSHSYRMKINVGVINLGQPGLAPFRAYMSGDRAIEAPASKDGGPPPAGQWYQNDDEALTKAYDGLALPHTFLAGPKSAIAINGAIRFRQAFGSVSDNKTITEVDRKDLVLSGNLVATPSGDADGGRRITTHVGGDLYVIDVAMPGSTTDWTPLVGAAIGGATLLGAVVLLWPGLKWRGTQLLLLPLYARLKKEDILENPLRDDILHVVQTTPGISASELGRRLECGWGTLVYHITVLERMGLVSSAREGRHKRFFAQGRINYSDKGAVGLLANPAARTILDAVRQSPGLIQKDLGEKLGLAPGTINWHVERLAAEGLLVKEEDGRSVRYYPSERLIELTKQLAA